MAVNETQPLLANNTSTNNTYDSAGQSQYATSSANGSDAETTSISSASASESGETDSSKDEDEGWLSLPKKKQIIILALCRLSEPISNTSLLSYVYYFIKSLPGADTPEQIAWRAGVIYATFSLCQFVTGMIWGRLSDIYGRRPVVVMGLLGSVLASLGLGFSKSFYWAVSMRMLSGASNATSGVIRTSVAELIQEKR
ncbi:hypothetical protein ABW20_dc0104299 [Dactylellina cionopaga]|nr:hypothetical protein ABW20_dc0104299 [Dactylellina cionopaga]